MKLLFIKDVWDILKEFFRDNYPLMIFIVLLLAVGYAIWFASKIYHKMKNLPCDEHKDRFRDHEKDIKDYTEDKTTMKVEMAEIKTSIKFMTKSLDALNQSLQSNNNIATDPFTQRQSPIQITPKGKEVVEQLGLYDMIETNWIRINALVEENATSKNPYDIQQFLTEQATVYPEKFIGSEDLDKIKTEAYKEGLNLMSYMTLIAVIVRDRYFKEHNIDLGEVDRHDPKLKK